MQSSLWVLVNWIHFALLSLFVVLWAIFSCFSVWCSKTSSWSNTARLTKRAQTYHYLPKWNFKIHYLFIYLFLKWLLASVFIYLFHSLWDSVKGWKIFELIVRCYYLVSLGIIQIQDLYTYLITFPGQNVRFTPCIFIYTFKVFISKDKGLLFSHPVSGYISIKKAQFHIQSRSLLEKKPITNRVYSSSAVAFSC